MKKHLPSAGHRSFQPTGEVRLQQAPVVLFEAIGGDQGID